MGSLIEVFDDVLPRDFCMELSIESFVKLKSQQHIWKTNYSWNHEIVNSSHPVLVRLYDDLTREKILKYLHKSGVIGDDFDEYVCMNYMWTKLSHIPWHDDSGRECAITIYLNEYWHHDWGGYFMYQDNNEIKCIVPKFNRIVKNSSNIMHSVSLVSLDSSEPRSTIQIFKPEKNHF